MKYNINNGLSYDEVNISRKKYGKNSLEKYKKRSFIKLLIESLGDPIIKILLIALAIKTIFLFKNFDWYETIGILIAIFLASFISSISEYGSEKAFAKMQEESSKIKSRVKRDGKICEISIEDVVVNDIVLLSGGDKVPADGFIIDGELYVDESSLNGESKEVYKCQINEKIEEKNKVYKGSTVYSKSAIMVVSSVGVNTIYGKIADELKESSPVSPLKSRLTDLARQISKIGYISSALICFSYLFSVIVIKNHFNFDLILSTLSNYKLMSSYIIYSLTLVVTIIIVAVPEGLPMMITLVLSSNMKRMIKNNVLVRKMTGIETAGNINILFTDKTGTLTKGSLEVVRFITGDLKEYNTISEIENYPLSEIIELSIYYNNESRISDGSVVGGNSTDRALIKSINRHPNNVRLLDSNPFDSKNKYSTSTVLYDGKKMLIKGAPEKIISYCKYYYDKYGNKNLLNKTKMKDTISNYTKRGMRVIALAINDNSILNEKFNRLILVSVILIKDEIRSDAYEGIRLVNNANIKTVMITGDNRQTAECIAKEVGLLKSKEDIVLTSDELNSKTDDEIKKIINNLRIVARALPQDKSRLVRICQDMGLVVGMTGDGVNDAPALKKADVGFSMGSGTEVSKEASDIVILDNNIISISKAILFGRTIFKSIRKFIILQLTINMCALSLSFIGPFIGINTPITVIQMLWINMVMDTLAGLAFAFEPPLIEYMNEKPKGRNEPIINKYMINEIFVTGLYSSILCILFLKLPILNNYFSTYNSHMTAFFGLFIFIDIFNSFNARTSRINLLSNIEKNKAFICIITFVALVQICMIYFGDNIFKTVNLKFNELVLMIILSFTVIPFDFIRKFVWKKRKFGADI